jgi:hypothetical protein
MILRMMILAMILGFTACKKDKGALLEEPPLNEMVDTASVLKYSGNFINGPSGGVSGIAKIYRQANGKFVLKLENFRSTSGPNLHVFVSKELDPKTYSDLGALKSLNGNQVYEIDIAFDPKPYSYVLIYCVNFNHLFGSASI